MRTAASFTLGMGGCEANCAASMSRSPDAPTPERRCGFRRRASIPPLAPAGRAGHTPATRAAGRNSVKVGESRLGRYIVLRPVGRLDDGTSGEFQARLVHALTRAAIDVIVDFAAVDYISSAGLRALISATRQ